MKTNVVEIFQTIRACMQPYTSLGYTAHKNSETEYDLWSEKNIIEAGEKTTERFFAGIYIESTFLVVKVIADHVDASIDDASEIRIENLDSGKLKEIDNLLDIAHLYFKEQQWI